MNPIYRVVLLSSLAAVYGTALGGAAGAAVKRSDLKGIAAMLSFAGGVMLAVVCFDLIPEALELSRSGFWYTLPSGIAAGYIFTALCSALVCRKKGGGKKGPVLLSGFVLLFAIALHNLPEGLVIGSACGADSRPLGHGFIMAAVLGLHNIPEGMAMSVTLCSGGMRRTPAVLLCALAGLPSVLGAVLGWQLSLISPLFLCLSLGFSAGAMLFVVLSELLPEGSSLWPGKLQSTAAFLGLLLGLYICRL